MNRNRLQSLGLLSHDISTPANSFNHSNEINSSLSFNHSISYFLSHSRLHTSLYSHLSIYLLSPFASHSTLSLFIHIQYIPILSQTYNPIIQYTNVFNIITFNLHIIPILSFSHTYHSISIHITTTQTISFIH